MGEPEMPNGYDVILRCTEELERELLRIGRERCDHLRQESQLSAVVFLLLRVISLFRSMVELLRNDSLDAFDAVRRAFLEGWLLAFQFRRRESADDAARWLARRPDSWNPRIGQLEEYARTRGHGAPNLGRDYGDLSELAHPTRSAAENSVALVTARLGVNIEAHHVEEAKLALERGLPGTLYRLAWLVLDEHEDLIPLYTDENNLRVTSQFANEYPHI